MHAPMTTPRIVLSDEQIDLVLGRIPPLWPLKHFVAVNPFVGVMDQAFTEASARLLTVTGTLPLLSPPEYRDLWVRGEITIGDLEQVTDAEWTSMRLLELVASDPMPIPGPIPTYADFMDARSPSSHWGPLVVEEISKWCAVALDENQTTWKSPWAGGGLYAGWREAARLDLNPEACGLRGFREFVAGLPDDAASCIRRCLNRLAPGIHPEDFLHRQLVTVSGWAGYIQYRVREDSLRGRGNGALRDLLAIRLAFDAALHEAFGDEPELEESWSRLTAPAVDAGRIAGLTRWQRAYENGYQRALAERLVSPIEQANPGRPAVQAVFCIDVRSEILRRHLESAMPGVQSIGFAGFFGFPIAHETVTGDAAPRCPLLLVPPAVSCEDLDESDRESIRTQRASTDAWRAIQNSAASCFSFVETLGLGFLTSLNRSTSPPAPACGPARNQLRVRLRDSATPDTLATFAEGALRNMSLTRNLARLVLICGHGSQSANNPFASGLDCGACGGHAGDVNARLAASALNDADVRRILAGRGIEIPADTHFVPGIHNTTTDEVCLMDVEDVPDSHATDLETLRSALAQAGRATRRERANRLGIEPGTEAEEMTAFERKATDISELRPEWGLANNAAFVAAPRSRTRGQILEGRVFLHDYDEAADAEDRVLTLILCAPVVVASWINLQYYGSRVNPELFGSGNKMLHNVVGGIGVLEGNGGDLRAGLPLQSLHDGQTFIHEPRRLSVYIEARKERIEAVLARNPSVKQLFDHGWIHLFALQGRQCDRYAPDGWLRVV